MNEFLPDSLHFTAADIAGRIVHRMDNFFDRQFLHDLVTSTLLLAFVLGNSYGFGLSLDLFHAALVFCFIKKAHLSAVFLSEDLLLAF